MTDITKWIGTELAYPAYTRVYTARMTIDEDTVIESGIQSGIGNYMRVGETDSQHTLLQFLDCFAVTESHVDRAKIVAEVRLDNRNLRGLASLLTEHANNVSETTS